jgi:anti-anti-sigma factor
LAQAIGSVAIFEKIYAMKLLLDKQADYTLVKLEEEKLDSMISPQLKSELVFLNSEGVQNIIFDMSAVKYVDSSGLSAILVGNRMCNGSDGRFVLSHVNPSIAKLIEISQLEGILATATDNEAAKAFFE